MVATRGIGIGRGLEEPRFGPPAHVFPEPAVIAQGSADSPEARGGRGPRDAPVRVGVRLKARDKSRISVSLIANDLSEAAPSAVLEA